MPVAFVAVVPVADVVGLAGGVDEAEVEVGVGDGVGMEGLTGGVEWGFGEEAGFGEGVDGGADDGRGAVGLGDGLCGEGAGEGGVEDEGLAFDGSGLG